MSTPPPFPAPVTRGIGEAERTLKALLQAVLDQAELSFPEWTTLVTLDIAGPLTRAEMVARQVEGQIAPAEGAEAAIDRLAAAGLLVTEPQLARTEAGEAFYQPLRQQVNGISARIYDGLPIEDLKVTQRVLEEVARRAREALAA